MKNYVVKSLSVLGFAVCMSIAAPLASNAVYAADVSTQVDTTDPYKMMNFLADNTFKKLKANKGNMTTEVARQIIRDELLPYIDNKYSSFKVMGTNLKNTTPEQRENFTKAFTDYIVATYADALKKYTNQTIKVQDPEPINDKFTSVKVTISAPDAPDVAVIFKMRLNSKTNQWKAYDMVAEGISLLSAKQSELSGMIRDKGIDEVSKMLEKHVAETAK